MQGAFTLIAAHAMPFHHFPVIGMLCRASSPHEVRVVLFREFNVSVKPQDSLDSVFANRALKPSTQRKNNGPSEEKVDGNQMIKWVSVGGQDRVPR